MFWNKPAKPEPPPQVHLTEEAPEDLRETVRRLQADFAAMQQEWGDTLDRIGRHFARHAARERQRIHRDLERLEGETSQDAPGDTISEQPQGDSLHDRKAALRARVNQSKLRRA